MAFFLQKTLCNFTFLLDLYLKATELKLHEKFVIVTQF